MATMQKRYVILWTILLCSVVHSEVHKSVACKEELCTVPADIGLAERHYVDAVTSQNEEKPYMCKADLCYEEKTYHREKGDMVWPETTLGQRVYHLCPYSMNGQEYAWRECLYDRQGITVWDGHGNVTQCPGPPLEQILDHLDQTLDLQENQTSNFTDLWEALASIDHVITVYKDTPISDEDIVRAVDFIYGIYDVHMFSGTALPLESLDSTLRVLNTFMDENLLGLLDNVYIDGVKSVRLLNMFQDIPQRVHTGEDMFYSYDGANIKAYIMVSDVNSNVLEFPQQMFPGFNIVIGQNISSMVSPNTDIFIRDIPFSSDDKLLVGVVLLKHASLIRSSARFMEAKYSEPAPCGDLGSITTTTTTTTTNTTTTAPPPENITAFSDYNLDPIYIHEATCSFSYWEENTRYTPVGSLVSVTVKLSTDSGDFLDLSHHTTVAIDSIPCPSSYYGDTSCNLAEGAECSTLMFTTSLSVWTSGLCQTTYHGDQVRCECSDHRLFALFQEFFDAIVSAPPPIFPEVAFERTELSGFVAFNYNKPIALAGHILGGISLFCLILTVLSHGLFRNTRHKRPSQILIHLCVSLILLTIILYLSSVLVTTITRCVIANILRYYLVFVSLFWNATEAVNLYLMLVMVFNTEISKFIQKAAILAWGLPAVMIAITLGVDKKTFHGHYIPEDPDSEERPAKCYYRCQLRPTTQHFAYLLPMCVIVLFNMLVYIRVLKEILAVRELAGGRAAQNKQKLVKVVGAMATLVLLGLPWAFSIFAVIDPSGDAKLDTTETVFQALFVVFVNLQGVFLFLFHCARSVKVRQAWKTVFSGTSTTGTGSSGKEHNATGSGNRKTAENKPDSAHI